MGKEFETNIMKIEAQMQSSFLLFLELGNSINSDNLELFKEAQKFADELMALYNMTNNNKIYLK